MRGHDPRDHWVISGALLLLALMGALAGGKEYGWLGYILGPMLSVLALAVAMAILLGLAFLWEKIRGIVNHR